MKKILLTLGAIGSVAAPMAMATSCGANVNGDVIFTKSDNTLLVRLLGSYKVNDDKSPNYSGLFSNIVKIGKDAEGSLTMNVTEPPKPGEVMTLKVGIPYTEQIDLANSIKAGTKVNTPVKRIMVQIKFKLAPSSSDYGKSELGEVHTNITEMLVKGLAKAEILQNVAKAAFTADNFVEQAKGTVASALGGVDVAKLKEYNITAATPKVIDLTK